MRRLCSSTTILALVFGLALTAHAFTFSDDFADGDTGGWIPAEPTPSAGVGNWRVVDGVLVQDAGGDGHRFLAEDYVVSTHAITTRLTCTDWAGYGGVAIWNQGYENYVQVILYPDAGAVWIHEKIDGVMPQNGFVFPYTSVKYTWYELRVEADSVGGTLHVYVNGDYLFTYSVTTTHRRGLSGLLSGNSGGTFDDVRLTYYPIDIQPGNTANRINLKKPGTISVAVLSSSNFDAPAQVDRTSLTFGRTGDEVSVIACTKRPRDVNGDELPDLVCSFPVAGAGFQPGDTEGFLKWTVAGISFTGSDTVTIVSGK